MATDGSTNISEEEKQRTRDLPHGSNSPAEADTASGGAPDDATENDDADGEHGGSAD